MKLENLAQEIIGIDQATKALATKAVNRYLTIRNWVIGASIVEFEQKGEERAKYGDQLLNRLASEINISGYSSRNLRNFRLFYLTYPQLIESKSFTQFFGNVSHKMIWQLATAKSDKTDNQHVEILQSATSKSVENNTLYVEPEKLISNLSFTHLVELFKFQDPYKRAFYEIEAIKGRWSVAQLKRQINTLYYERSAISKDPKQLQVIVNDEVPPSRSTDLIKDVMVMEFLDLPTKLAVKESDLETALLDNIEHFLLELGHGFCFEARQQKILIGEEYYFIDLVFYHRILKCHVLIELKVEEFTHHNAGQLNTYINYYKDQVMQDNDQAPIGLLMVTNKNNTLVEYATGGMDENLFVRKYMVELPKTTELQSMIEKEIINYEME